MSRPKLLHTHSTLLDRSYLTPRRPRNDAYGCSLKTIVQYSGAGWLRERTQVALNAQWKKLWQGCGKNPGFVAKTDIIDKSQSSGISNLRAFNGPRLHPAYRLIRPNLSERKALKFFPIANATKL
jgi:hypothetical protein